MPFNSYKVYGPYQEKSSGREIVVLVHEDYRTTMQYARYLMAIKLDRWLFDDEQVDHIDNDPTNNAIDNLQILTHQENSAKTNATGRTLVWLTCPQCGKDFTREKRQVHPNKRKPNGIPCCSRSCAGKYQHRK